MQITHAQITIQAEPKTTEAEVIDYCNNLVQDDRVKATSADQSMNDGSSGLWIVQMRAEG